MELEDWLEDLRLWLRSLLDTVNFIVQLKSNLSQLSTKVKTLQVEGEVGVFGPLLTTRELEPGDYAVENHE